MMITELQFADDAAAVGVSRESIERAAHMLDQVTTAWGLTMSIPETATCCQRRSRRGSVGIQVLKGSCRVIR